MSSDKPSLSSSSIKFIEDSFLLWCFLLFLCWSLHSNRFRTTKPPLCPNFLRCLEDDSCGDVKPSKDPAQRTQQNCLLLWSTPRLLLARNVLTMLSCADLRRFQMSCKSLYYCDDDSLEEDLVEEAAEWICVKKLNVLPCCAMRKNGFVMGYPYYVLKQDIDAEMEMELNAVKGPFLRMLVAVNFGLVGKREWGRNVTPENCVVLKNGNVNRLEMVQVGGLLDAQCFQLAPATEQSTPELAMLVPLARGAYLLKIWGAANPYHGAIGVFLNGQDVLQGESQGLLEVTPGGFQEQADRVVREHVPGQLDFFAFGTILDVSYVIGPILVTETGMHDFRIRCLMANHPIALNRFVCLNRVEFHAL